jgi:hypothetical protein
MPYNSNTQSNFGSFIPTTSIIEVSHLYDAEIGSPEFKDLLAQLATTVNNIALVLNTKDSAFYLTEEFVNGHVYFNPTATSPLDLRPGFRKLINLGALGAGIKNVAHGLTPTATWKFVKINGAASNSATTTYVPLPFAGIAGNITIQVGAANITVTNNSGLTFDTAYIVLEYLKY